MPIRFILEQRACLSHWRSSSRSWKRRLYQMTFSPPRKWSLSRYFQWNYLPLYVRLQLHKFKVVSQFLRQFWWSVMILWNGPWGPSFLCWIKMLTVITMCVVHLQFFAVHTVSFDKSLTSLILNFLSWIFQYRKVVSTSTSRLEANDGFFRLSMKGKFYVYFTVTFWEKVAFLIINRC